ncbi:MAG: AAA family ATPase [Candidatus Micrarchaeota archaeon]
MNEKTLIDFLALRNPWWNDRTRFPSNKVYPFKRRDFFFLQRQYDVTEATVIVGPRGVGKSTILFELIRKLLSLPDEMEAGSALDANSLPAPEVDGERILYLIFDDPNIKKQALVELLTTYAKLVLNEDLAALKKKIFVFLDEIQELDNWGSQVASIQNLGYPIKFFVSGSPAPQLLDQAAQAARRIAVYRMPPMKFSDFVRYKFRKDEKLIELLKTLRDWRKEAIDAYKKNDPIKVHTIFLRLYTKLKPWQTGIELHFEEYLVKGGYPALMDEPDFVVCAEKLKETFWLGFRQDAIKARGVGDPDGLFALARYIAAISGQRTNMASLQRNASLSINTDSLKRYIYHLESGMLISRAGHYSRTNKTSPTFKVYMTDVALRNLLVGRLNLLLRTDEKEYGQSLETAVYDHMLRLKHKAFPDAPLSYWMEKRSGKEVDIIARLNGTTMPVEVKKEDSPDERDAPALTRFCGKSAVGTVVCGKKLERAGQLVFVPHWLFLLIC